MLQECLGENNRDWRLCQKGISVGHLPGCLHACSLVCYNLMLNFRSLCSPCVEYSQAQLYHYCSSYSLLSSVMTHCTPAEVQALQQCYVKAKQASNRQTQGT